MVDPAKPSTARNPDHVLVKCVREMRVGIPTLSEDRVVRIPIQLEEQDGLRAGFEMQWRYPMALRRSHEDSPNLENLFTLTAILPILNYLPFCETFTVEGPLEPGDVEWLTRLAEATAREIQRHKLTAENPYLRAEMLPRLLAQPLVPPPIRATASRLASARVDLDPKHAGVILDGGAEGLLSWALLKEIGANPLAIFFDSPPHGLGAATNAFEHLTRQNPDRAQKVWTNLPLLYEFILRHLDFLRLNYQTLHAETTPLRLFETEVNVLAALPLLFASGVGHMVVPRRSDSLERRLPGGLSPTQPFFDQSRAFDDYVTRFFSRKGWGVQQWTLLRSATELIVQRALSTRYPDLFPLQVGCRRPRLETRMPVFLDSAPPPDKSSETVKREPTGKPTRSRNEEPASPTTEREQVEPTDSATTHGEGLEGREPVGAEDLGYSRKEARPEGAFRQPNRSSTLRGGIVRASPCGACEACRRLVVILSALGYDPKTLGYSVAKIERALSHTVRVGHLSPEARVQRHVLFLIERGQGERAGIPSGRESPAGESTGAFTAPVKVPQGRFEAHPEVEALRFDSIRAFIDTIPLSFRRPAYAILLQYANGALQREGRDWKPIDLLSCPEMDQPKQPRDLEFLIA